MFSNIWESIKKIGYTIWDWMKSIWQKFLDLTGWSANGTILKSRITMLIGLLTSAFGLMDWSPLLSLNLGDTGFSWNQVFWLGGVTFVKGLIDEIVRRWNAIDL